jgi:hypothetical protein
MKTITLLYSGAAPSLFTLGDGTALHLVPGQRFSLTEAQCMNDHIVSLDAQGLLGHPAAPAVEATESPTSRGSRK